MLAFSAPSSEGVLLASLVLPQLKQRVCAYKSRLLLKQLPRVPLREVGCFLVAEEKEHFLHLDATCHMLWQAEAKPHEFRIAKAAYENGTVLEAMAEAHMRYLTQEAADFCNEHMKWFPEELNFGGACSGSGMDSHVMRAVQRGLESKGVACKVINRMACELQPIKRDWIEAWLDESEDPCLFADVCTLSQNEVGCYRHGIERCAKRPKRSSEHTPGPSPCRVPTVDLFFCGSSCKYFSNMVAGGTRKHGHAGSLLARHADECSESAGGARATSEIVFVCQRRCL